MSFVTIKFPIEVTLESKYLEGVSMEDAKWQAIEACLSHLGFHDHTYSQQCSVDMSEIESAEMENWDL